MLKALIATAVPSNQPSPPEIVDLRARMRACAAIERQAWDALQMQLQQALEQHSKVCYIECRADCLRVHIKTLTRAAERRLANEDGLLQALKLLDKEIWPEDVHTLSRRGWFLIDIGRLQNLYQIDFLRSSAGCDYTIRCLYDVKNALPQLDQFIRLPGQAAQLRNSLRRDRGLVLLADVDRVNRITTARAMAQDLTGPNRRILVSETLIHPLLPGTTQVTLPLEARTEHHQAWRQACDMAFDVIFALEIDQDQSTLVRLASETTRVVQGLGAGSASQALAQLIAAGVRPEALARIMDTIIVQHQVELACERCKVPCPVEDRFSNWVGKHSPLEPGAIQDWLAERISDNYVQANGCDACHETGVGEVINVIDCIDISIELQDALCDGDVRYALNALDRADKHKRQLIELARRGSVSLSHAMLHMNETDSR